MYNRIWPPCHTKTVAPEGREAKSNVTGTNGHLQSAGILGQRTTESESLLVHDNQNVCLGT